MLLTWYEPPHKQYLSSNMILEHQIIGGSVHTSPRLVRFDEQPEQGSEQYLLLVHLLTVYFYRQSQFRPRDKVSVHVENKDDSDEKRKCRTSLQRLSPNLMTDDSTSEATVVCRGTRINGKFFFVVSPCAP